MRCRLAPGQPSGARAFGTYRNDESGCSVWVLYSGGRLVNDLLALFRKAGSSQPRVIPHASRDPRYAQSAILRLSFQVISSAPVKRAEAPLCRALDAGSSPVRTRVLHVNSGNLYGGVETILVTLARLRDLCPAMESHFALCHTGRLSRELLEAGVAVELVGQVRVSRPWTVWRARRRLIEILRREKFDMVICHMPWSMVVFGQAVRASGQRLGFWAHTIHTGRHWLERLARLTKPDLAIASSSFMQAGLSNIFPDVPMGIVHPPITLKETSEVEKWRSNIRQQQGVSEDTVVILQVSRMEAGKGHYLHLEALERLKHLDIPWVCWMVGGAQRPQEQEYLRQLRQAAVGFGLSERVRFLGERADVPELLAAADIFCQPNKTPESFGIVFIEALWAGRPVVSTAMGGALEIIDESCGLLVEPENIAGLAESLRRLIESRELRPRLGSGGAARARQLCDPAAQMERLRKLSQLASPDSTGHELVPAGPGTSKP
jgi:glycosyltransferase involved in cell wall biosynthesis